MHRIQATISRKALQHNLALARTRAPHSRVVAMIKANAYGHGLIPVAEALAGADVFGVTDIDEALLLDKAGTGKPIVVLQGLIHQRDVALLRQGNFQPVIHRQEDLHWLEAEFAGSGPAEALTLWLKLDSGMGRLGLQPEQLQTLYPILAGKPWVKDIIVMTHLANSAQPDSPLNDSQLATFAAVAGQLALPASRTSIAASAGLLALDAQSGWCRPGLMLYGSSPFAWSDTQRRSARLGLQAAMQLAASLISIKDHKTGDNIGYNSQFICPQDMRIGIVSAGYADGYPACTPNGSPVMVAGTRTTTVGRVSMDMLAIDLAPIPQAAIGMPVELWGNNISIDEVAAYSGVISYQLMSGLTGRVPRVYK